MKILVPIAIGMAFVIFAVLALLPSRSVNPGSASDSTILNADDTPRRIDLAPDQGSTQNPAPGQGASPDSPESALQRLARQSQEAGERIRQERADRDSPTERSYDILSREVFMAISEIQSHMQEQRWADVADGLSALYARWDDLNDFEKSTLLNFYTNLFLANNMIGDAILTFEAILEIPSLRQDIELRSLRALGQLNMAEENYAESIAFYNAFLDVSEERDGTVLLGLANSHYSLGEFEDAIPHLIEHIEILQAQEASVDRNKYGLLNLLYVESGDLDAAVHTTQTMIDQYNEPADWRNLGALYSSAGEPVLHEELLRQAREAGHLDANGVWSDRRP